MKKICTMIFAVALGTTACKSRDFNSQSEQQSISNGNGKRITYAAVGGSGSEIGWCYFNMDNQFSSQKIDSGLFSTDVEFTNTTRTIKKYKVDYTLRQYKSAHVQALKPDAHYSIQDDGSLSQREARSTLVNGVSTEIARAGLQAISGTLCSDEILRAGQQIDTVVRGAGNDSGYIDHVVQCRNNQPSVLKLPQTLLEGAGFQWLVGELGKLASNSTKTMPNLKCPTVIQQIDITRGAFVGTKTCNRTEPCEL